MINLLKLLAVTTLHFQFSTFNFQLINHYPVILHGCPPSPLKAGLKAGPKGGIEQLILVILIFQCCFN